MCRFPAVARILLRHAPHSAKTHVVQNRVTVARCARCHKATKENALGSAAARQLWLSLSGRARRRERTCRTSLLKLDRLWVHLGQRNPPDKEQMRGVLEE